MKKKPTPSPEGDKLRHNPRPLLRTALIVAAYLCAFIILDLFSQQFEELRGIVAWYPPAGLTYTLLLVFGVRFAPAVTIALFISNLFIYRMPQPPYLIFLWAFIISLIYGAAAAFLRHRIRFDWQLRKMRDVTWLVGTTVFVSALLAVLSVSSSALSSDMPRSEVLRAIFHWWIGETVGVLTVIPFLLIHVMPRLKRFVEGQPVKLPARRSFPRPTLSIIGQVSSLVFILYWVFGARVLHEYQPLYLISLPLIWIALDHGLKGITTGIMALNFGVILAMWFFRFDLAQLGELQLLMIVNCIVGLFMGAVVTERKRAEVTLAIQARVASIFGTLSNEEMFNEVLKVILEAMHSPFGVFGYIDDNGDWVVPTMTRQIWDMCQVPEKTIRYPPETWGDSSWPRALREKRTIHSNKPSTNIPDGHISIQRHISMPILFQGEAIGLFQVANKETDYTEADIRTLGELAGHVAPLLSARLRREQGQEALRESEKRFLAESNQSRLALLSVVEDQKQAQEALVASEAELRALFAGMMDVVIVYDADGRYIEIAPTNPANLYRPLDDMLGKTVHDILPKEQADYIVAKIGEAIQTGQVVTGEYALQVDGKETWFASSASRLSETTAVWVARDITERKRAEEQIQRQVETLGALYNLSSTLLAMEDFNAILDLVTRFAVESTHVTFARVLLLEQDDLVARAAFPVRALDQDLQVGQREPLAAHPSCQRVLEGNTPLVLQLDSLEAGECAPFFLGIAQTLCIVPLHVHEHSFGLLILGEARDAAREPFTADKILLARSIGDQAVITLHRALLHEETERRLQSITALRTIDSAIAASMDLRMTLSILLENVLTQLKVDAASVLLLNPHMQTLEYAAGRGFRTEALQRTHLRLGEGYAGRAAVERKLIYIPELRGRKTDFLRSPYFSAEGFVAYYGVPLIAKGQVKGVLEVFHRAPLDTGLDWVNFLETLAGQAAIAVDNTQLFDTLQRSNADLTVAYDATIEGWSAALDLRDRETEGHSQRVTEMTMQVARSLGIGEAELVHVRRGALLHDIGKMGVPDSILLKPDKLSDEEWVIMRRHPQFAFDMLSPIAYLRPALDIPYCHHEKWDGTGYPRGLKGEQIPLAARLFAVVDVWDALQSDRPYRKAWPEEKALEHIKAGSGTHFDPEVVKVFLKAFTYEE